MPDAYKIGKIGWCRDANVVQRCLEAGRQLDQIEDKILSVDGIPSTWNGPPSSALPAQLVFTLPVRSNSTNRPGDAMRSAFKTHSSIDVPHMITLAGTGLLQRLAAHITCSNLIFTSDRTAEGMAHAIAWITIISAAH